MDKWHKIMWLQLCMVITLGLIGIECVVLWLSLDYYFCFVLGVWVATYIVELIIYIHIKKCHKKIDRRKRKE